MSKLRVRLYQVPPDSYPALRAFISEHFTPIEKPRKNSKRRSKSPAPAALMSETLVSCAPSGTIRDGLCALGVSFALEPEADDSLSYLYTPRLGLHVRRFPSSPWVKASRPAGRALLEDLLPVLGFQALEPVRFEGCVLKVAGPIFIAELRDLTSDEAAVAEFWIQDLEPADMALCVPGALFFWDLSEGASSFPVFRR